MFDVFTEEVEILIKDGIANLYWYKGDLHKAWLRSGVPADLQTRIATMKTDEGKSFTKRQQMDALYDCLRSTEYNRRLEVSRNFVRILIEHRGFTPQDPKHRIEVAERAALKLRELLAHQEKERERREGEKRSAATAAREAYEVRLNELRGKFMDAHSRPAQEKGYVLESIFTELMRISGIPVEEPFKISGEQLDGAIKHEGHYYLIELKWTAGKTDPKEIGHFYYKVDGKLEARGIFLSINGFTSGVLETLPKGKNLKVLLLDGSHLMNVLQGLYRFQELLEHSVSQAALRGNIYCSPSLQG